jgi:hypothetical protein
MSERYAKQLLFTEDSEKLKNGISNVPPEYRGRVAEKLAKGYDILIDGTSVICREEISKAEKKDKNSIRSFKLASILLNNSMKYFLLKEQCLAAAVYAYKTEHDIEGMKRAGRERHLDSFRDELQEIKLKFEGGESAIFETAARISSDGNI